MSKLIDLTHTFTENMPVYPGDPCAQFHQIASIEKDGFNDHKVEMGLHVGTHMDAPFHMVEGGRLISELPLSRFSGVGHLLDVRGIQSIEAEILNNKDIGKGDILLFLTGFSKKFREPAYYETYPELAVSLAERIVKLGVGIVGLDTPSPDRPPFPVHKILLGSEVLIIENLTNLEPLLEAEAFRVTAYPTKFAADAAPLRVVAEIV